MPSDSEPYFYSRTRFSARLRINRKTRAEWHARRLRILAISIETLHLRLSFTGRYVYAAARGARWSGIESFIDSEDTIADQK